jgi:3-phenylpropionate/trans-cinnamate dioxygenase ferredoxin component
VTHWHEACRTDDIDREDVIPVELHGVQYAVYHSADGKFFATDGFCTHEQYLLTEGFVMGNTIECPKHNGVFNYTTGEGMGEPICVNLKTYPVRVEGSAVFIRTS